MPKVSVIIPTYNRAQYIGAAIESILLQTFRDFEIIVVDDGSTDDTEAVLKTLRHRLNYVRQAHSGLPAVARNNALRNAKGEYIAFLDSDDVFLPGKLASQTARLDAEPQLALVYSNAEYFRGDGSVVGTLLKSLPPIQGQILVPLLVDNFLATCSVLVRKSCLDTVGFFDESPALPGGEDYDLWLRIAAHHNVGFVKGMSSRIRLHDWNISGGDKIPQYVGVLNVLAKVGRLDIDLLAGPRRILYERRALIHLAAARAYFRRRALLHALSHLARSVLANPDPHWLVYLISTSRPAQTWLEHTMTRVLSHPSSNANCH